MRGKLNSYLVLNLSSRCVDEEEYSFLDLMIEELLKSAETPEEIYNILRTTFSFYSWHGSRCFEALRHSIYLQQIIDPILERMTLNTSDESFVFRELSKCKANVSIHFELDTVARCETLGALLTCMKLVVNDQGQIAIWNRINAMGYANDVDLLIDLSLEQNKIAQFAWEKLKLSANQDVLIRIANSDSINAADGYSLALENGISPFDAWGDNAIQDVEVARHYIMNNNGSVDQRNRRIKRIPGPHSRLMQTWQRFPQLRELVCENLQFNESYTLGLGELVFVDWDSRSNLVEYSFDVGGCELDCMQGKAELLIFGYSPHPFFSPDWWSVLNDGTESYALDMHGFATPFESSETTEFRDAIEEELNNAFINSCVRSVFVVKFDKEAHVAVEVEFADGEIHEGIITWSNSD